MLLSPQITGRRGPQRSGEYRLRRGGVSEGLVASYTFDDGVGTVLHDRRGYWPRGVMGTREVPGWVVSGAGSTAVNGTYYRADGGPDTTYYKVGNSNFRIVYSSGDSIWMIQDYTNSPGIGILYQSTTTTLPSTWTGGIAPPPTLTAATPLSYDVEVVSAPLDGTLTNFTSDYQVIVNGGSFSNTVFTPSGTEYGKTKYLSPDGNYKVSYWYMMDPEMDGAWYIWAATASDPWMDGYLSTKAGTGDAWGGTYSSSYTVAQGDLQPGPWFADGLQTSDNPAYVTITTTAAVEPGTGDFTVAFDAKWNCAIADRAGVWFHWTNGTKQIMLYGWPDDGSDWTNKKALRLYMTDGTHSITADFANTRAAYTYNTTRRIVVTFERAGYAKCFIDGQFCSQVNISSVNGDLSGLGTLYLATRSELYATWALVTRLRRFDYWQRALTDDEAAAWTANPWRVFSQPRLPLMAFTAGGGGTVYFAEAVLSGEGLLASSARYIGASGGALSGEGLLAAGPIRVIVDTATLAGEGLLGASAGSLLGGDALLSGEGTLSSAGALTAAGTGTLSGEGAVASAGSLTAAGDATLTGDGALTAAGIGVLSGSSALTGDGTLAAIGLRLGIGSVSLVGNSALTALGFSSISGAATLSGDSTLTALGLRVASGASASLSGSGTLTALLSQYLYGTANLSGDSAVGATGSPILAGQATLAGTGTATATGNLYAGGSARLSSLGSLASVAARILGGAATLTGDSDLSTVGIHVLLGATSAAGTGALTAEAVRVMYGDAALSGEGLVSPTGVNSLPVSALLVATGTLAATAGIVRTGAAGLVGTGTAAGTATRVFSSGADLSAIGDLDAAAWRLLGGRAQLAGESTVTAGAYLIVPGVATLRGDSAVQVAAYAVYQSGASLAGAGTVVALSWVPDTHSYQFTPLDEQFEFVPLEARFRITPLSERFKGELI